MPHAAIQVNAMFMSSTTVSSLWIVRGTASIINYIEKNWLHEDKRPRWVGYARENYQHIDTNNLIESWHKTLRHQFLGRERNVRPDYLIYLLQGAVEIGFRVSYLVTVKGAAPVTLDGYLKKRKAKAL
ncbi:hypothetical protein BGX27_000541 [Mortierella sp. AM989]|nr:hypothetical protein BGX27_000541 [Mortierella sp. AM989]